MSLADEIARRQRVSDEQLRHHHLEEARRGVNAFQEAARKQLIEEFQKATKK